MSTNTEQQPSSQPLESSHDPVYVPAKTASSYDGWIVSESFWKRALAIWGHMLVLQLIVGIISFALFVVFGMSLIGSFMNPSFESPQDDSVTIDTSADSQSDIDTLSTTSTSTEFGTDVGGEGMGIE